MEALLRNSLVLSPKAVPSSHRHQRGYLRCKKKRPVRCHSGRNVTDKTDKIASKLNSTNGAAVIDPGNSSLDFTPNGNNNDNASDHSVNGSQTATLDQGLEGVGIVKFLRGKTFFVTGATGFLAKVLIEKLLRTVPDIDKIYVLIKARNRETAITRLKNEILSTEIFKCVKQTHGKSYQDFMLSKLIPVAGNIRDSDLGLDENSTRMITDDVDVIVNSAANTNFHERYDVALDINTVGPARVMDFAKKCRNLKLILQVSTAYVNGQRQGRIMERTFKIGESIANENHLYKIPSSLDVENELRIAMELAESLNDGSKMKEIGLERARKHGWQDTYVFTKAMGEMLLDRVGGDVPVVILRPSVIESTSRDPFPGWIEGNRMMDPVVTYYGKGQLSGFPVDPSAVIDVVPADMVVNATLAAIAKHGQSAKPEISVYQVASSVVNPLVYKQLAELLHRHFTRWPCLDAQGRPVTVGPFRFYGSMEEFSVCVQKETLHHITDNCSSSARCSRRVESVCRKIVEQAKHLASVYEPYSFYGGRFDNSSTNSLMESMSEEERKEFYFDVGNIDWEDYICNVHILGLRRRVMKGIRRPNTLTN